MNLALWIVQVLLAVTFLASGGMKVFAYEKYKALSEKNGPSGIPHRFATFVGIAELAGGMGVVLPMAIHIAPGLTGWAAAGLATIMLLAVGFHIRLHESPAVPAVLFLLAGFVAFGRFSRWM